MIQFGKAYSYSKGKGSITFQQEADGRVSATYTIYNETGTLIGNLSGSVLEATFDTASMGKVGLINFTFVENGFTAKWKTGLTPGPMRGLWITDNLSAEAGKADSFEFNTALSLDDLSAEFDRVVELNDISAAVQFSDNLIAFVNQHPEYYWFIPACKQMERNWEWKIDDDGLDLSLNFNIKGSRLAANPYKSMTLSYSTRACDFSDTDGAITNFFSIILKRIGITNPMDLAEADDSTWNCFTNLATSCLFCTLCDVANDDADAEELADMLLSVSFDYKALRVLNEAITGGDISNDIRLNVVEGILGFKLDDYDDGVGYGDYTHNWGSLAQDILDRDIFDIDHIN